MEAWGVEGVGMEEKGRMGGETREGEGGIEGEAREEEGGKGR